MQKSMLTAAKIILGLLILTSILYLIQKNDSGHLSTSKLDLQIPQFSLPLIRTAVDQKYDPSNDAVTVKQLAHSDLLGHMTLINFWASWCEICASEASLLRELYRSYGEAVKFVGIASNDTYQDLQRSGKMNQLPYDLLLDQDGFVARSFQVGSLPETFVIGKDGNIMRRYSGALNNKSLEEISQIFSTLPSL